MTAGRKPKPTALKLVTGNAGHRPLNRKKPKPEAAIPECPEFVQGEARKTWHKVARKLHRIGLLTEVDDMALAVLCQSWAEYLEASARLRETGMLVKSPNGYPMMNPCLAIANQAVKKVRSLLAEFGMSPSSRSRIAAAGHTVTLAEIPDVFLKRNQWRNSSPRLKREGPRNGGDMSEE